MALYSRESIETLKTKIDLVDVVQSHIEMKRAGGAYKGLCPFHEEKSPSFIIQKGDTHYHCFGCQAHGDAISFLMNHLRMGFSEAVEHLAERFDVPLVKTAEKDQPQELLRKEVRRALADAAAFYHFYLLHTEEGRQALAYLYERGLDLDFIKMFQIGLAPEGSRGGAVLKERGHRREALEAAGLVSKHHDFFHDRITFPIRDAVGHVVGFSARKIKEETFGGKYINTAETLLFKKSHLLFGLSYSRHRIAKERKALIVEGQIDALRLIQEGFDYTVAGQGTAFTETHADILVKLGVKKVLLAFDSDRAGQEAASKVGDIFMKLSIEVLIVRMPADMDPDSFLLAKGPTAFQELLAQPESYISFLIRRHDTSSPTAKAQTAQELKERISAWNNPLLVHESLKQIAALLQVPEETLGLKAGQVVSLSYQKRLSLQASFVDPIKVLEMDLIRLLLMGADPGLIFNNLGAEQLLHTGCREMFVALQERFVKKEEINLLDLAAHLTDEGHVQLLNEILQKKVNQLRLGEHTKEVVKKILERNWMQEAENLRLKIQSLNHSEEEALALAKELTLLKKNPPNIMI